jgi:hypothetical protein
MEAIVSTVNLTELTQPVELEGNVPCAQVLLEFLGEIFHQGSEARLGVQGTSRPGPCGSVSSLRGRALQNAYELAIGGRNQDATQLALSHVCGNLIEGDVRAKGARARLHHLFNELLGVTVQGPASQQAKHDALLVHHHATVPPRSPGMLGRLTQAVRQVAGGYIASYVLSHAGNRRTFPLRWQAAGQPVYLARHIVIHLSKAEASEPPRGSGAQVSTCVVAVDDDRSVASQLRRRFTR